MTEVSSTSAMDRPIHRAWWQTKAWIRAGIAVGVLLLITASALAILGSAQRSVRMATAQLTIATVEHGVYHDFIPLRAKVVPLDTIYLDTSEGGRVDKVLAQAGDTVTAEQPLVQLSNSTLELDVLDREGRLVESITQVQSYETQLEQNRVENEKTLAQVNYDIIRLQRSLDRRKELVTRGLEAVEVKDKLQDELDHDLKLQPLVLEGSRKQEQLREQQLPQIQAQLETLRHDLKITHATLENLLVRAPVTGRLTAMDLKVGQNLKSGERLAELTPDTGNKLAASVDEYYLGRVHVGQAATVDLADQSVQLTVTRVYPQVKDGLFTVDLRFEGSAPTGLLPGEALQGKLALGTDSQGTLLPAGGFLERTGGDWVFVLAKDGKSAYRRTIKIGRRNAEQVEVLGGLAVGEQAIISDYTGLERIDRVDLKQ
jgi:HlyD family secretion protein